MATESFQRSRRHVAIHILTGICSFQFEYSCPQTPGMFRSVDVDPLELRARGVPVAADVVVAVHVHADRLRRADVVDAVLELAAEGDVLDAVEGAGGEARAARALLAEGD